MNKFVTVIVACLALASAMPVAYAQTVATGQNGAVAGGRTLHVLVAQAEIKSDINPSNIAVATGGGLLGALIETAVDSARAKKSEELITPVRAAMADHDADAVAIEAAKAAFGETEWFKANPSVAFGKDSSVFGKSAVLDKANADQVAFVEYTYDLSANFDSLRVGARIDVADKAIPASAKGKAEKRLSDKHLAFTARATSVVMLAYPSADKAENAAAWSADGAALARKAMKIAFENLVPLTQRTLTLTPDDKKLLNDKKNKKTISGGFTGRPQEPFNSRSTLLWDGSFINIEYMGL